MAVSDGLGVVLLDSFDGLGLMRDGIVVAASNSNFVGSLGIDGTFGICNSLLFDRNLAVSWLL